MSTAAVSRLADDTAPLDVLLVDAALGQYAGSSRTCRPQSGRCPSSVGRGAPPGGSGLGAEAGRILTGTSTWRRTEGTGASPTSRGRRTRR